jgi:hypothetical protein
MPRNAEASGVVAIAAIPTTLANAAAATKEKDRHPKRGLLATEHLAVTSRYGWLDLARDLLEMPHPHGDVLGVCGETNPVLEVVVRERRWGSSDRDKKESGGVSVARCLQPLRVRWPVEDLDFRLGTRCHVTEPRKGSIPAGVPCVTCDARDPDRSLTVVSRRGTPGRT